MHLIGAALEHQRQVRLMQALVDSSQKLLTADSETAIYDTFERLIQDYNVGISFFYLARYDKRRKESSFPVVIDRGRKIELASRSYQRDTKWGLTEYIISQDAPYVTRNLYRDRDRGHLPVTPIDVLNEEDLYKLNTSAYYGTPIRRPDGEIIGVVAVQRYVGYEFSEFTQQILLTLAAQLGLALDYLDQQHMTELAIRRRADSVWENVLMTTKS